MTKNKIKAFIFDLDGTLYLGENLIEGASETIEWVRKNGGKIRFVTNNPRDSKQFYTDKLNKLGIVAGEDEVMTSANLTAEYLKSNPEYGEVFVIGEEQLIKELSEFDIPMVNHDGADTVLVSFDTTLDYEKLQTAYQALLKGANFIATNPDAVCPTPEGGLVDAGAIIAALEVSTKRKLDKVIGKPSTLMAELLIKQFGENPENCIVVGDRLNTDIRLGIESNMNTAWINAQDEAIPKDYPYKPDYEIKSISELPNVLG